jgi:PAS domain S-box-containing protein
MVLDWNQVIATTGDAIVACDARGAILLWNPAAERLFGYSAAEAMGQSLDLIIPERQRQRHWEGYHKTMATGVTKYGTDLLRVPAVTKSGGQLSISFTVSIVTASDGVPQAIVALIRDETAHFKADRELRKRLADLEAQVAAKR